MSLNFKFPTRLWEQMMLSTMRLLGRRLPNVKGKYLLVFKGLGSLVSYWPSDVSVLSKEGMAFVHCDLNDYIFKELFVFGVHELDVDWMFQNLLRRGDIVFDAGASFGFHSLSCAVRVGPEGHIYGVEPQPDMFDLLQENIEVNRIKNVSVERVGLSDAFRSLELHRFAGLGTGHTSVATLDRDDYETLVCDAVTLDDYIEKHAIRNLTMLKLDVEGSELLILKGATGLLGSDVPPMCIVEINMETSRACGYHPDDLLSFLKPFGYSFYRPTRGSIIRNISRMDRCDSICHGDNILCVVWPAHKDRLPALGIKEPAR